MSYIHKLRLMLMAYMTISILTMASTAGSNKIKIGNAPLSITVECPDTTAIENANFWVQTAPIFMDMFENQTYKMDRHNNTWTLDVPIELQDDIIGIVFDCGENGFGTLASITQIEPTELTYMLDENLNYTGFRSNRSDMLDPLQWDQLNTAYLTFLESTDVVPDSLYDSWQKVREYETNVMWPQALERAQIASGVDTFPEWFVNSLRCRFASIQVLPYVKAAERMNGLTVEDPPIESYYFLNTIDYSPIMLKRLPYMGLKSLVYAFLRFPNGGFCKIGDTPVDVWQKEAKNKMLGTITQPSQLLLDLLSAMSYIEQIEIDQTPLSETQINNINSGFTDDLGKIILSKNEWLLEMIKSSQITDLVNEKFDLKEYIDSKYPGRPVIVDLWNSWCSPCLDAMGKIEEIRENLPKSEIEFLYIADESSNIGHWRNIASNVSGDHVRINASDSTVIGNYFSLSGFPSYLIFDREHKLVVSKTGFPGIDIYSLWINMLK